MATEADIDYLKVHGSPGDFIFYVKEDDKKFPMRIAFLKVIGGQNMIQKLKILRSKYGYAFTSHAPKWCSTMSDMIDNSTDENSARLRRPFLGMNIFIFSNCYIITH